MLQLRPSCECCDVDLPPEATNARICSFECTFCADCAEIKLHSVCPNCGGELVPRPRRPAAKLAMNPASTTRVFKPQKRRQLASFLRTVALPATCTQDERLLAQ